MSRALGAAFLNHQVEQLEKTVSAPNGPASGNWRRRQATQTAPPTGGVPNGTAKRPPMAPGIKVASRRPGEESQAARKGRAQAMDTGAGAPRSHPQDNARRSTDDEREGRRAEKDADVVVVDASVLVHALYQLKKWCREGREEVVIVPLEGELYFPPPCTTVVANAGTALNTLDLLKKGTTPLAQRARAASRVLEAQVGTNSRIRVQQDDAFVLWDQIAFNDSLEVNTSPEWVRRTICCAQWEIEHGAEEVKTNSEKEGVKVVLAILAPSPSGDLTGSLGDLKLSSSPATAVIAPVPLPAPHVHANKHEVRSSGTLVARWATRARIAMLPVDPAAPAEDNANLNPNGKRIPRPRRTSEAGGKHHHGHGGGLVERPPAVMAMMEMVAQPSKVVRVLARGEKLDPDP
ncbi:hypothetical protein DXG03_009684 [Asterophora parasitica]|uniref:PIN domain-containing protein n=1 Tax=Asterophora parasitica TaxID=117018 RepID=A0A9P7GAK5_9AGAR|nr:hypothetical protein DXG03_009684 [Asterophora parasitica]